MKRWIVALFVYAAGSSMVSADEFVIQDCSGGVRSTQLAPTATLVDLKLRLNGKALATKQSFSGTIRNVDSGAVRSGTIRNYELIFENLSAGTWQVCLKPASLEYEAALTARTDTDSEFSDGFANSTFAAVGVGAVVAAAVGFASSGGGSSDAVSGSSWEQSGVSSVNLDEVPDPEESFPSVSFGGSSNTLSGCSTNTAKLRNRAGRGGLENGGLEDGCFINKKPHPVSPFS